MRKTNILEISLALLAIVLLVLFVVLAPQYVTAKSNQKHYEDRDISFDYPLDWSMDYYENPAARLFLSVPTELDMQPNTKRALINSTNNSSTNFVGFSVTVNKIASLPPGISLENAYQGEEFYVLMQSNPSYKFSSRESITLNNATGYKFTYEDQAYQFQDYWLTKNGKYYEIVFQIPKGNNITSAKIIADSFRIK